MQPFFTYVFPWELCLKTNTMAKVIASYFFAKKVTFMKIDSQAYYFR